MQSGVSIFAFVTHVQAMPEGHEAAIRDTQAGDWFVVAHLGFFFLLLVCFAWAAWGIWRRTTRPAPHMQLIMEMCEGDDASTSTAGVFPPGTGTAAARPWEKPEDWWKKA